MKILRIILTLTLISSCSFDNKSGIWKNTNEIKDVKNNQFSEFETLSSSSKSFSETVSLNNNYNLFISEAISVNDWSDQFFTANNTLKNFKYNDSNLLRSKSKKISKHDINPRIISDGKNLILTDIKGNLIFFSLKKNKIIKKFNFYKKRYKNIQKNLNIIADNQVIYVSDNLGYLYAFDYSKDKILWAKNYKIPFRSNLKISENKLLASNQNNTLNFYDISNGNLLRLIPTEETIVKNNFINNLSVFGDTSFFLNTYGSLYSLNNEEININWFINLNQSLDINPSNLFLGTSIINDKDNVITSSDEFLYVLDISTGSIKFKKNFPTFIQPILVNDKLFLITKNGILISMSVEDGNIIYSYDINEKISKFLKIKKKSARFKSIMLINSKLFIFLENSYVLKLGIDGNIDKIFKLPTKIRSYPIIINESLIYLDKNNKISILN